MINKILLFGLLIMSYVTLAQNSGIGINPTGVSPNPSAGLDINFNDKGFLIPRLTTTQRNGIQNPAIGLQIYNTTTSCLQIYMPLSSWRDVSCDCSTPPSSTFTFADSSVFNSNVVFNASTSGIYYSWTFQGGTPATSTQQSPTVLWATPGIYGVSLTVSDSIGCTTTATDSITITSCSSGGLLLFSHTGSPQSWTVPSNLCNNYVTVEVWGAQGGSNGGVGGLGGYSIGELSISPNDVISIYVGGEGSTSNNNVLVSGGFNGGGSTYGLSSTDSYASSGGGASDVRLNGTTLSDRVIVAGGGGGGGQYISSSSISNGGYGGSVTGGTGNASYGGSYTGGGGGTQVAGGSAGTSSSYSQAGSLGNGGNSSGVSGGWNGCGGGGGYYGGGSGAALGAGGGGGSGYLSPTLNNAQTIPGISLMPDPNGGTMTGNSGDGYVRITW